MFDKVNCLVSDFETIKKNGKYKDKEMESLLSWYHSGLKIKVRGNKLFLNKEQVYEIF